MSFKRESEIDMDQVAAFLKDAVNKVKTEENADLLNDLKKVYKQNVPFTLRMYVAAYLVKEARERQDLRVNRHSDHDRSQHDKRDNHDNGHCKTEEHSSGISDTKQQKEIHTIPAAEEHTPRPRVQIDEPLASTIFISIGRNRRVYPRDLVGLLISVAGLDRERIGDIRVLANYSFVQLFKEDTDKAINALNGYDYRGRKLVVSYSRQKDEETTAAQTADTVPAAEIAKDSPAGTIPVVPAPVFDAQTAAEDAKAYAAAEKAASDKEPFIDPAHAPEDEETKSDSTGYLV
jgi:hypothetical protein